MRFILFLVACSALLAIVSARREETAEDKIKSAWNSAWNWMDDNMPKELRPGWRNLNEKVREGWQKIKDHQKDEL
jgi:hypothetical protein